VRLLVALATPLIGCSLLTDTSDLGPSDAGGTDVTISDVADVSVDTSDAAPPQDSGCGHAFCDDFDDHALGTGWDTTPPTTVTLSDAAVSPPNALQAVAFASPPGNDTAFLLKAFPSASYVQVQVDMRTLCQAAAEVDTVIISSGACVETVYASPSGAHGDLTCANPDGGTPIDIDTPFSSSLVSYDVNAGGLPYHHYDLKIDATTQSWGISVDGTLGAGGAVPTPISNGPFTLAIGLAYHSSLTSTCAILIDNVTVDTKP
jgi:hypothetical protein